MKIGILTVSDRASRGEYEDRSGPAIKEYLNRVVDSPYELHYQVVPDERQQIADSLIYLSDEMGCSFVVTTGGTGPAKRDITPDVTEELCEKLMPGFGEQMRRVSVEKVPTAILSRQTAGIRGNSFLLNLPGSPKAIAECLDAVFLAIPDCLEHISGSTMYLKKDQMPTILPHAKS